ncbi:hypothetical protein [Methylobacterium sp. yr668]|nr:hypothetical protein [Methylobacterium sp. yr668]
MAGASRGYIVELLVHAIAAAIAKSRRIHASEWSQDDLATLVEHPVK